MRDDKSPVIVGIGQFMQKDIEPEEALEPLGMIEESCRIAFEDAQVGKTLLKAVDYLAITDVRSWRYNNLPCLLSERLGLHPRKQVMTTMGGNMSQWLINQTASSIQRGEVEMALLTGGESYYTARRARFKGIKLPWSKDEVKHSEKMKQIGSPRLGLNEHEFKYNIQSAIHTYALFENAWRANRALSIEEHRQCMGSLMSRLSEAAAANPYARFPQQFALEEIIRVSADNRMVCFPYTKRMIANLDVNKSSTILMTNVSKAQALGIPRDRWIYWWGGGDADENPWFVSERPDFHSCPAIKLSACHALAEAGISIAEVDVFDLYSCFHIAIQLAREEMGVADTDSRPISVTGGLPYSGQAGSNCGMESVAMMVRKLRTSPGFKGLVTGNGWFLTKQSTGIYCSEPKERRSKQTVQLDDMPIRKPVEVVPEGQTVSGTVETYTIEHSRDGKPKRGLIVGRTDNGRRFLSHTPTSSEFLQDLMKDEIIGLPGSSVYNGETQIFNLN